MFIRPVYNIGPTFRWMITTRILEYFLNILQVKMHDVIMSDNASLLGYFFLGVKSGAFLTKMVCFNLTGCLVEYLDRRYPVINGRWAGDVAFAWIRILQVYKDRESIIVGAIGRKMFGTQQKLPLVRDPSSAGEQWWGDL